MKRLILLADDSPTIQRLVTQIFAGGEFDVVSVSNGDAAVRKFEEIRPDVVLADIYMPGKNGYEVCAAVKKHPEMGDTPVVLLAGAFDAFDQEAANQAGAATHITKPFEAQALLSLVASLAPKETRARTMPAAAPAAATIPAPAAMAASAAAPAAIPAALSLPPEPLAPEPQPQPEPVASLAVVIDLPRVEGRLTLVGEEQLPVPDQVPTPEPAPELASEQMVEETPMEPAPAALHVAAPVESPVSGTPSESGDLLGLQDLFKPQTASNVTVSDAEIERIAQLVIQKLSTQVIENVAWDVVPDITTKVLKEELKRRS